MPDDLYTALAKANETITNPAKDGKGNYGAYLTLDQLLDHVRGPLAAQGLSIVQDITTGDGHVYVTTSLVHASGQRLDFGPLAGPAGQNWQQLGGATTYARRYALCAALGISGDSIDDDAQAHTDATPKAKNITPVGNYTGAAAKALMAPASSKQIGMLKGCMRDKNVAEYQLPEYAALDGFEMPADLDKLTKGQASALIERLLALPAEKPVERAKPTGPDPDDPWAAPLVDPVTGEVAK